MNNLERTKTFTKLNPFRNFLRHTFPSLHLRDLDKSHRNITEERFGQLKVIIIPTFKDNYTYILVEISSKMAVVIDPGDFISVLSVLDDEGYKLTAILNTHHHSDHVGGNKDLVTRDPSIRVYGGDDRIPYLTDFVTHDELIKMGKHVIECISTPCHTTGHMCYYVRPQKRVPGVVFTGDCLFVGGCGRQYEGKSEAMKESLYKLACLPGPTLMFCGHEYTIPNLKFARIVEPENLEVAQKLEWAISKQSTNEPTVPSTIEEERRTNPFMRIEVPEVQTFTKTTNPDKVIKRLRRRNKKFR